MNQTEIEEVYKMICDHYEDHLKKYGVKLPKLRDKKGRVRGIANPLVVKKCKVEVKRKIYKLLYNEFDGENPNKW